jgi:hypothetical protein
MSTTRDTEKDFQTQADEYANNSISCIKEMTDALDHAEKECDGEVNCDACTGTGECHGEPCTSCDNTGLRPCTAGKDSEDPEAWHDRDQAEQRIHEDALSVEVRSDWYTPGDEDAAKPSEYKILITTGGPAARIIGDLNEYGEPTSARFQYQDWFKPWTVANTTSEEDEVMLRYARCFYFGEGQ